ncbi:MAG: hypothetical protein B655_2029 [Methanobacterium sp. Maddingley MBC34]|nr:MAG: hypothetical protein B655_2029 [Methanobacterium sp. Maddingley MBC34]
MKLKKLKDDNIKAIICIFILFSITLVVFQYTVEIREPWFGELSSDPYSHQWLTGSTLEFSENWYREGPLNWGFVMLETPASIEFTNSSSREPYLSYLPGSIIPIYTLSKVTGTEPNASLVMGYNLFNHFTIALLLSLLIFVFLRQIKIDYLNSFLFATIPIFLELLLPGPLYWHQNVFFADQAVILPFVLYIFLEIIRDGPNCKYAKVLCILQNLVLFYGIFTDWLFVFIALTVYLKRIFEGKIKFSINIGIFLKENIKFWSAPLLAAALYLTQIFFFNQMKNIIRNFFYRSGLSTEGSQILTTGSVVISNGLTVFIAYIIIGYGEIGLYALCFSFAILVVLVWFILSEKILKKDSNVEIKRICALMAILLIPCILQVLVFRNHSIIHTFSVLKFSVPLTTIPFVLCPISIYLILKRKVKLPNINLGLFKNLKVDFGLLIIFLMVFTITSFYVVNEHPNYKEIFPETNHSLQVLGDSIQKNTQYSDVVFSPDFEIKSHPPQQLAYSMKKVYKINSTEDIGNYTRGLSGYHVVIMFIGHPSKEWEIELVNASMVQDGDYYYYRLN